MTYINNVEMPARYLYKLPGRGLTAFTATNEEINLNSLFGVSCGIDGNNSGIMQAKELACVSIDKAKSDAAGFTLEYSAFETDHFFAAWRLNGTGLELSSNWRFCPKTGVWSRKDKLVNTGNESITITRCLARFIFSPGSYEVYSQSSSWCNENYGVWQTLHHGSLVFGCEGGRTTQGSTPYLCIKENSRQSGVVFHIIPEGNWIIKVIARTGPGYSLPFAVVELGLSDENLYLGLKAGQSIELPEILIQELMDGDPVKSAARLHRYLLEHEAKVSVKPLPVVYNTWFDLFDKFYRDRLEKQLTTAKALGCEVFTVDAGWFGAGEGNWYVQTGDWREKVNGGFNGKMLEFADEVRAAGLGFGLWMEPERIGAAAPVLSDHPEWFISAENGSHYLDLTQPEAYRYIIGEISRIIETYRIVWLKFDFNFSLGIDPYGSEFLRYYGVWYNIIKELRAKYPGVFFEGCAGGGMRLDIQSQMNCDAHFISDNANPSDILQIYQGAILRLLPGHLTKWAILRPLGKTVPICGRPIEEAQNIIITADGPTWEFSKTVDPGFLLLTAMPGVMGLGGDIAGLPDEIAKTVKAHINFYKAHRELLYNSIGYQLTPLWRDKADRRWTAVQLQDFKGTDSMVFVYRLDDSVGCICIMPRELDGSGKYKVEYWNCSMEAFEDSGEKLMDEGINVEVPSRFGAAVAVITLIKNGGE
jgi:Alpha-galactosidase